MSQIYNDNIKRVKPQDVPLRILKVILYKCIYIYIYILCSFIYILSTCKALPWILFRQSVPSNCPVEQIFAGWLPGTQNYLEPGDC